jgi:transposase
MDVHVSHDLSSHPQRPEQGALVPVSFPIVVGSDSAGASEPDLLAVLWRCFCRLAWLFFLALVLLRRLRRHVLELRWQANYWQGQHRRAVQREGELAEQVHNLQGEIRELKRRLFGRKSESSSSTQAPPTAQVPPNRNDSQRRSRGQQRGGKGHGRRNHDHLPTTHEDCDLADDQKCCPACGEPYEEIPGTADGDILEILVRAHRRRYRRKRFRRVCACPGQPAIITAPPPDKLIPKSNIGLSLWVMILQRKFEFFQPLHRILAELRSRDLCLSAGTITGGLQQLVPLFQPLYELLVDHNRGEKHWHCDETRWRVFVHYQAKANFTWYLWVFAAKESIVFVLDPTRAHNVPENHFGDDAEGVANVDRYSGYKAMAQAKAGRILLAFCWAHVRRDFLAVLTGWPELTAWAWSWVEEIGLLYHRNDQRLTTTEAPTAHAEAERLLREHVEHMRQRCDTELALPDLRLPQRKTLASLHEHWPGLTLFVDHPHLPLDNNEAERRLRGPVLARKNFYGSAALWSGRLAAMLFSLFQTIHIWGMDVGKWLTRYLSACANARGKPPPDPQRFLPWNMTPQERERLSQTKTPPPDPEPRPPTAPPE